MTIREAREQGLDVFFFRTREQREAHGQFEGGFLFEERGGEGPQHYEFFALAVRPRTNTTARGQREFFNNLNR